MRLVWKAVLDDLTCERCTALDGAEVPEQSVVAPPLHGPSPTGPGCRCVVVAVDDEPTERVP